jgi:hypothetical protein
MVKKTDPADRVRRAASLYERFQGKKPTTLQVVEISTPEPDVALVVGTLHGLSYRAKGDGKLYFHKFKNRPLFAVSYDGKQIYILKGGYRFTERGIVG